MQLTNEQKEILSMVSKFGCLDIEQIKILMQPCNEKTVIMMINIMIKNHMLCLISERYVAIYGSQNALQLSTIACVWVMMEMSSSDEIKESMKAEPPSQIYFTANRKDSFEMIYIDSNNLFKLNTMQEKYKNQYLQKASLHAKHCIVLVINDENNKEMLMKIKEYHLNFPFILALVPVSVHGKPSIRFLKSTP